MLFRDKKGTFRRLEQLLIPFPTSDFMARYSVMVYRHRIADDPADPSRYLTTLHPVAPSPVQPLLHHTRSPTPDPVVPKEEGLVGYLRGIPNGDRVGEISARGGTCRLK